MGSGRRRRRGVSGMKVQETELRDAKSKGRIVESKTGIDLKSEKKGRSERLASRGVIKDIDRRSFEHGIVGNVYPEGSSLKGDALKSHGVFSSLFVSEFDEAMPHTFRFACFEVFFCVFGRIGWMRLREAIVRNGTA